jgi:hypothetical protein
MRPVVVDAFPFNNELDILTMRLTELYDAVDRFVIVEATRDHQDHVKPLWYADNKSRFAQWADKIEHVIVRDGEMPSMVQDNDPWAREYAQREYIARGVGGLDDTAVILQSDVDEIPRALQARNVRPGNTMLVFEQRLHCFAVDWLHPDMWYGTVAATLGTLGKMPKGKRFIWQRDARVRVDCPPHLRDAGWHFSWLGGAEAAMAKVGSFCHPEVEDRIVEGLATDRFYRDGYHVDGTKMSPVDVNDEWPQWIVDGNAPQSWYRQR